MRFEFTSPTRLLTSVSFDILKKSDCILYIYLSEQSNTMLKDMMSGLQIKMISIFCLFYSFASQKEPSYGEKLQSTIKTENLDLCLLERFWISQPSFLVYNRFQYILFQTTSLLTYCQMLLRKNWMILHKSYDPFKFQSCKKWRIVSRLFPRTLCHCSRNHQSI